MGTWKHWKRRKLICFSDDGLFLVYGIACFAFCYHNSSLLLQLLVLILLLFFANSKHQLDLYHTTFPVAISNSSNQTMNQFKLHNDSMSTERNVLSDLPQDNIRAFIEGENRSNRIVLWSVRNSPYCAATKKILQQFGVVVHELDDYSNGDQIQRELRRLTSHATLPIVFVDDTHLGGYDAVRRAYQSGALHQDFSNPGCSSSSSSLDFASNDCPIEDYFVPRTVSMYPRKASLSTIAEAERERRRSQRSHSLGAC